MYRGYAMKKASKQEEPVYTWECDGKIVRLYGRDIYYIHLEQRKVYVHTRNRIYYVGRKMREEEERLKDMPMLRPHYSYLVHLKYMESVSRDEVIMRNGVRIPVSGSRKKQVWDTVRAYLEQQRKCKNAEKDCS